MARGKHAKPSVFRQELDDMLSVFKESPTAAGCCLAIVPTMAVSMWLTLLHPSAAAEVFAVDAFVFFASAFVFEKLIKRIVNFQMRRKTHVPYSATRHCPCRACVDLRRR